MNIEQALKDVVVDMEGDTAADTVLWLYIKQLRLILTMVKSNPVPPLIAVSAAPLVVDLDAQQEKIIDRKIRRDTEFHETNQDQHVLCVGGHMDGATAPLSPAAPVGAKTFLAGQVYEKRACGNLYYHHEETVKFHRKGSP